MDSLIIIGTKFIFKMEFKFGIPKKRQKVIDQYPDEIVISVLARPEELKGASHRIKFLSDMAIDLFSGTNIIIGQYVDKGVSKHFIADHNEFSTYNGSIYLVANNGHLNNKSLWTHYREVFKVENDEFLLKLTPAEIDNKQIYILNKFVPEPIDDTPSIFQQPTEELQEIDEVDEIDEINEVESLDTEINDTASTVSDDTDDYVDEQPEAMAVSDDNDATANGSFQEDERW